MLLGLVNDFLVCDVQLACICSNRQGVDRPPNSQSCLNGTANDGHKGRQPPTDSSCHCHTALSIEAPLRAAVNCNGSMSCAMIAHDGHFVDRGGQDGILQGQTQAFADVCGTISFTDLTLVALPGLYNISVVLPGQPQVCTFATASAVKQHVP